MQCAIRVVLAFQFDHGVDLLARCRLRYREPLLSLFLFFSMDSKRSDARKADSNKPVKVMSLHGMRCSIFANKAERDGEDVTYHKISLVRVYKDGDEFKTTTSFSRDDLPTAMFLMNEAYGFILGEELAEREGDDE